jgi:hypothetical protein
MEHGSRFAGERRTKLQGQNPLNITLPTAFPHSANSDKCCCLCLRQKGRRALTDFLKRHFEATQLLWA